MIEKKPVSPAQSDRSLLEDKRWIGSLVDVLGSTGLDEERRWLCVIVLWDALTWFMYWVIKTPPPHTQKRKKTYCVANFPEHISKLPPELTPEVRSTLLKTCFDRVFSAEVSENSVEEKPPDSSPLMKNLGILVEELLIDDVSPATLDDISTLLEPWLVQRNIQQRAAAVYVLRITLQAYYNHMTFGYENPSKFSQAGMLLARSVLRCLDEEGLVRAAALDCAKLILLITAKYEGHSVGDPELEQAFASMSISDSNINEQLARWSKTLESELEIAQVRILSVTVGLFISTINLVLYRLSSLFCLIRSSHRPIVASKLPHYQLYHFADTVLQGLSDLEPANVDSVSDILVHFFQAKGSELYHHINDILAGAVLEYFESVLRWSREVCPTACVQCSPQYPVPDAPLDLQLSLCEVENLASNRQVMGWEGVQPFISGIIGVDVKLPNLVLTNHIHYYFKGVQSNHTLLLVRLAALNPSSRVGAVRTVLHLARHHPKAVVNVLLDQPLPLHM
ncbi:Mroh1p [Homalodisca vitripennis]|nr:Mroh1p [Homalodisca vitripennis]